MDLIIFVCLVLFVSWVRRVLLTGQAGDAHRYNGPQSRLNWSLVDPAPDISQKSASS